MTAEAGLKTGLLVGPEDVVRGAQGQGFQHVRRRCRAKSLCGSTTKLPPSTGYENDGHGSTFWQLVQQ